MSNRFSESNKSSWSCAKRRIKGIRMSKRNYVDNTFIESKTSNAAICDYAPQKIKNEYLEAQQTSFESSSSASCIKALVSSLPKRPSWNNNFKCLIRCTASSSSSSSSSFSLGSWFSATLKQPKLQNRILSRNYACDSSYLFVALTSRLAMRCKVSIKSSTSCNSCWLNDEKEFVNYLIWYVDIMSSHYVLIPQMYLTITTLFGSPCHWWKTQPLPSWQARSLQCWIALHQSLMLRSVRAVLRMHLPRLQRNSTKFLRHPRMTRIEIAH